MEVSSVTGMNVDELFVSIGEFGNVTASRWARIHYFTVTILGSAECSRF